MAAFNQDLQLYTAQFNDKEFTAENHLARAFLSHSEWLSQASTFLYGDGSQSYSSYAFPMLWLTEGLGRVAKSVQIGSADLSYKWPVLGRPKKTSTISRSLYSSTDTPGKGFQEFIVPFKDRWFFKSQTVYTPSKIEVRVQGDPKPNDGEFLYRFKIITNNPNTYVPYKDIVAGVKWAQGIAKVSKNRSRGVEHRSYTPYALQNQLSVVRDTYNIVGNMGNKVMVYNIKADGRTFQFWSQWEMYLSDIQLREKLEHDLWHSQYNKDADGVIHNDDEDSGEVVTSGAGLLQQIDNVDTYVKMTTKKIETIVNDLVFNASGAQKVTIEIFTGTGGMNEVSRAMEDKIKSFTLVEQKIMQKQGDGKYMLNGPFFSSYVTREGHKVNFRYHPMFDRGPMAEISGEHPIEGYPIESYNMYAVDMSIYEGEPNVQYVSEKGREEIKKVVQGMARIPGIDDSMFAASDIDASSIERMKTQGIVIKRPTNCLKVFNTING